MCKILITYGFGVMRRPVFIQISVVSHFDVDLWSCFRVIPRGTSLRYWSRIGGKMCVGGELLVVVFKLAMSHDGLE